MDWANEPYVRLYTRETTDDALLSWEALALWHRLLTKFDKSGVLPTRNGWTSIAALLRMPQDVVSRAGAELLTDGRIRLTDSGVFCPNFTDAQTAVKSDRVRQRESRDRRRTEAAKIGAGGEVVDSTYTERHEVSHDVTPVTNGHAESQGVTKCHSYHTSPFRSVPDLSMSQLPGSRDSVGEGGTEPANENQPDAEPEADEPEQDSSEERDRIRAARLHPRSWQGADYFRSLLLREQPGNAIRKKPWGGERGLRLKWAEGLNRIANLDGREWDDIAETIKWLFEKQASGTHRFVVHSPDSLREKWDRIAAFRARPSGAQQTPQQRLNTEVRGFKLL